VRGGGWRGEGVGSTLGCVGCGGVLCVGGRFGASPVVWFKVCVLEGRLCGGW